MAENGFVDRNIESLTDRQREVLEFIGSFISERGYPPTIRELANHLDIVSLNAVRRHLMAIEKKGFIRLDGGRSRGIQLSENSSVSHIGALSVKVPLLGQVSAGCPATAIEDVEDYMEIDPSFWGVGNQVYLLRIKGASMEPDFLEGDLVLVDRNAHVNPGDIVVALINDNATVKQMMRKDGETCLHPLNPAYDDIPITEGFSSCGKVIGLMRRYR